MPLSFLHFTIEAVYLQKQEKFVQKRMSFFIHPVFVVIFNFPWPFSFLSIEAMTCYYCFSGVYIISILSVR